MNKKILVIGTGFLGEKLVKQLKENNFEVLGTSFKKLKNNNIFLDISNLNSIQEAVEKFKPKIIINCAANTDVDLIESDPDTGYLINSFGPKNLAITCHKNKIKLIHISTDSIFDGKQELYLEEDIPNPINVYSKSKLLGEKLIIENLSDYIIIRTNFFGFHKDGNFLLNSILKNLHEKKEFNGFDDVFFNPMEILNLNEAIIELCNQDFTGIINLTSDKIISKYQFALNVARIFNLDSQLIKKGSIKDSQFIAKRPINTSLLNLKAKQILKTKIMSIEDSLKKIQENINF